MTFHPNAPASLIAQAKHPLLLLLIKAFHPFSAQMALTRISMSEPNWRLLDSMCIFAVVGLGHESLLESWGDEGDWIDVGWEMKLVMQSMMSTLGVVS